MKSFEDWYFELFESGNGSILNQQEIAEEAWDFRQAEVDELRKHKEILLGELFLVSDAIQYRRVLNLLKGDQS